MTTRTKNELAGLQLRSFTFWCVGCEEYRTQFKRPPLKPITSTDAARDVRRDGWCKKSDGWYCPKCK